MFEVLQKSKNTRGVPFSAQNRMLALLAPMHRDIIHVNQ
jgi:hemoglobin